MTKEEARIKFIEVAKYLNKFNFKLISAKMETNLESYELNQQSKGNNKTKITVLTLM